MSKKEPIIKDNLFGMGNLDAGELLTVANIKDSYISEGSYYGGDMYDWKIRLEMDNEKFKVIKKKNGIQSVLAQLNFILVSQGLPMGNVGRKTYEEKRASKGVKVILVKILVESKRVAYGLGLDTTSWGGSSRVVIENGGALYDERRALLEKVLEEMEEFKFDLNTRMHQYINTNGVDKEEAWRDIFQPEWAEYLDGVKKLGIAPHKFS